MSIACKLGLILPVVLFVDEEDDPNHLRGRGDPVREKVFDRKSSRKSKSI